MFCHCRSMAAAANYNRPKPIDPIWYRLECDLSVQCACGHGFRETVGAFVRRHRLNQAMKLHQLIDRLRCTRCGGRPYGEVTSPGRRR